jgi:hypothetical protein
MDSHNVLPFFEMLIGSQEIFSGACPVECGKVEEAARRSA